MQLRGLFRTGCIIPFPPSGTLCSRISRLLFSSLPFPNVSYQIFPNYSSLTSICQSYFNFFQTLKILYLSFASSLSVLGLFFIIYHFNLSCSNLIKDFHSLFSHLPILPFFIYLLYNLLYASLPPSIIPHHPSVWPHDAFCLLKRVVRSCQATPLYSVGERQRKARMSGAGGDIFSAVRHQGEQKVESVLD